MAPRNQPAFPALPFTPGDMPHLGMSLLAYFMAHAPAEPQPWFEPKMPPSPKTPDEYLRDGEAWDCEHAKQRYLQWPLAWALPQLAILEAAEREGE